MHTYTHIYRYTYMYLCVSVGNGQKSRRTPNRLGEKGFKGEEWSGQQNTCDIKIDGDHRGRRDYGEMGRVCVRQNKI